MLERARYAVNSTLFCDLFDRTDSQECGLRDFVDSWSNCKARGKEKRGGLLLKVGGLTVLAYSLTLSIPTFNCAAAENDWVLRRQTMSNVCHVQLKTAAPLGKTLVGSYPLRIVACQAALDLYDKNLEDTSKCWSYGGGTVAGCSKDGITLPK